ncbi:MAG: VWA containing CoxE family protein [Xenococcaceae cyanobacterium]
MFEPYTYLTSLFNRLRQDGFNLGVSEYLAAVDAIEGGWGTKSPEALKKLLGLLWCSSLAELDHLQIIFSTIVLEEPKEKPERSPTIPPPDSSDSDSQTPAPTPPAVKPQTVVETQPPTPDLSPLPVKTPLTFIDQEEESEFQTYYPISRRYMVYSWRYLRRPVADGPEDVLDVSATVEQAAKQGFFLQPAYRRRECNHAHLLILIDQEGSMNPFHRFSRDLVETAQYESTIERVEVGYFHNVPAEFIYRDSYLTEKVSFEAVLNQCDSETGVLIVSDGGAARGYRQGKRFTATTSFLWQLKQHTSAIAWLNPLPRQRWQNTTAQFLIRSVPMFPMNRDGLTQAIATLQGQLSVTSA